MPETDWSDEELTKLTKLAYTSGFNAARNFRQLTVDQGWQDWLDYMATATNPAEG